MADQRFPRNVGDQDRASNADHDAFERYREANAYLNEGLIRTDPVPRRADGWTRREWMQQLMLPRIGHPERAMRAVHVAGTSGKGSVSTMIAEILRAAGWCTGLHVSPYVQVATEKLWVDGAYASPEAFAELVAWLRPIAESCRGPDVPLHGMASVALFLEHFRRERVDVAVVEVGVGGRDDLTNVLDTAVAVITNVGFDHTRTLGATLPEIAEHKVGIIRPGCRAVVFAEAQDDVLLVAARKRAAQVGAPLRVVGPSDVDRDAGGGASARFRLRGRRLTIDEVALSMSGGVQGRNAALALAACEELDLAGERIDEAAVRCGLARARLPARFEQLPWPRDLSQPAGAMVLLDGAHNADKLRALRRHLVALAPQRVHLLCGALEAKDLRGPLGELAALAESVVVTQPPSCGKPSVPAEDLARSLRHRAASVSAARDPALALEQALAAVGPHQVLVATGSLYLVGALRDRWYPARHVALARHSWPDATDLLTLP